MCPSLLVLGLTASGILDCVVVNKNRFYCHFTDRPTEWVCLFVGQTRSVENEFSRNVPGHFEWWIEQRKTWSGSKNMVLIKILSCFLLVIGLPSCLFMLRVTRPDWLMLLVWWLGPWWALMFLLLLLFLVTELVDWVLIMFTNVQNPMNQHNPALGPPRAQQNSENPARFLEPLAREILIAFWFNLFTQGPSALLTRVLMILDYPKKQVSFSSTPGPIGTLVKSKAESVKNPEQLHFVLGCIPEIFSLARQGCLFFSLVVIILGPLFNLFI